MIEKLSFTKVLAGVMDRVREGTGLNVYDIVPKNMPVPCCFVELVGQQPGPSKTMWKEVYSVMIHAFANGESSVPIFDIIQKIEESLTVEINLPEGYQLLMQEPKGLQNIFTEEDDTKHAILSYEITICYGFKMKI